MNEPIEKHAVSYCPTCRKAWVALADIEPAEPWESSTPVAEIDGYLTECPKCGGEMQVLAMSDRIRAAIAGNRASEEQP